MDEILLSQLAELAKPLNKKGVKPVICGGLGVYLCFRDSTGAARGIIRATNDIDFMITKEIALEHSRLRAISEIIIDELEYAVRPGGEHFRFIKDPNQELDILSQPIDGFKPKGNRVNFVKSKLHGFFTKEALYIDEDLRTVAIKDKIEVQVPSPTNLLILKLCAFDDRDRDNDIERAQAHAYDIYIIITLSANMDEYRKGQNFLENHKDWEVIQRVKTIVDTKFKSVDNVGWQRVLETANFYPGMNITQKSRELEKAGARLSRWFEQSENNHSVRS